MKNEHHWARLLAYVTGLGNHERLQRMSSIIKQDHRAAKRRFHHKQGFRSFRGAQRTISGYEAIHMIWKGQVRWLPKGDVAAQVLFICRTFGLSEA